MPSRYYLENEDQLQAAQWTTNRTAVKSSMALDVDTVLKRINQFGPYQIRILTMFMFIFFPITYQTLIMVFVAYEPPWMCQPNSTSCIQSSNISSGQPGVYSTVTKPKQLYQGRCKLNQSDWKFADYHLYDGPHQTIVNEVKPFFKFILALEL